MQRTAACLASWFSVDGPLSPDCSAPLSVSQLTKLNTADSPLTTRGARRGFTLGPFDQVCFLLEKADLLVMNRKKEHCWSDDTNTR